MLVAYFFENLGKAGLPVLRWFGGDIEKIVGPCGGDEDAGGDECFTGSVGGAHGDQERDETPVVGDSKFLTCFDPG